MVHLRGFGRARPGGKAPSPQSPFALGSTTKSFTALAMMPLVEAGNIKLDAPVQRYLPWFVVLAIVQVCVTRTCTNKVTGLKFLRVHLLGNLTKTIDGRNLPRSDPVRVD